MEHKTTIGDLEPGTIINVDSATDLVQFEDLIAEELLPNMSPVSREVWGGRRRIDGMLKPKGFYGNIGDIALEVIGDPYERLLSAGERGVHLIRGEGTNIKGHQEGNLSQKKDRFRGFNLEALASSTGRGVVGRISLELYFYPVSSTSIGSIIVKRVVSKPNMNSDIVEKSIASARAAEVRGLKRLILTPMQN